MAPPPPPKKNEPNDASDPHHKIVKGFTHPAEEWRSMTKIHESDAITWGIFLNRHAGRPQRNAHRVAIAKDVALLLRSQSAWGSHEAANVAAQRVVEQGSFMDNLAGMRSAQGQPQQPTAPAPTEEKKSGGDKP